MPFLTNLGVYRKIQIKFQKTTFLYDFLHGLKPR